MKHCEAIISGSHALNEHQERFDKETEKFARMPTQDFIMTALGAEKQQSDFSAWANEHLKPFVYIWEKAKKFAIPSLFDKKDNSVMRRAKYISIITETMKSMNPEAAKVIDTDIIQKTLLKNIDNRELRVKTDKRYKEIVERKKRADRDTPEWRKANAELKNFYILKPITENDRTTVEMNEDFGIVDLDIPRIDMRLVPLSTLKVIARKTHMFKLADKARDSRFGRMLDPNRKAYMMANKYILKDSMGFLGAAYKKMRDFNARKTVRTYETVDKINEIIGLIDTSRKKDTIRNLGTRLDLPPELDEQASRISEDIFAKVLQGQYTPVVKWELDGKSKTIVVDDINNWDIVDEKKGQVGIKAQIPKSAKVSMVFRENEYDRDSNSFKKQDKIAYMPASMIPFKIRKDNNMDISIDKEGHYTDLMLHVRKDGDKYLNLVSDARTELDKIYTDIDRRLQKLEDRKETLRETTPTHIWQKFIGDDVSNGEFTQLDNERKKLARYRKNFFPRRYHPDIFPSIYSSAIYELQERIDEYESQNKTYPELAKDKKTLEAMKGKYDAYMNGEIQGLNIDEITGDAKDVTKVGEKAYDTFKATNKHLDKRFARTDGAVIQEYTSNLMKTYERNKLVLDIMQLMTKIDETRGQKYRSDAIVDEDMDWVMNRLKITLGHSDVNTRLPIVHKYPFSIQSIYNKIPFKFDRFRASQYIRAFNQWITGNLLSGFPSTIRNMAGGVQKAGDVGIKQYREATQLLKDDYDEWHELAERAGVLDTQSFFADFYVDKALRSESKQMRNAVKLMIKEIQANPDKYDKASEKEARKLLKNLNLDVAPRLMNKATRFALNAKIGGILPGMADAEINLRLKSFVVGSIQAAKLKAPTTTNILQFAKEDKSAVELAREFTFTHDFLLNMVDYPDMDVGEIGNIMSKLKSWEKNKFSYDLDLIKQAWYAVDVDAERKMMGKGATLTGTLVSVTRFARALFFADRKKSPELAKLRAWFFTYGITTMAMDFLLYTPGIFWKIRGAVNSPLGWVTTGLRSPVLSITGFMLSRGAMLLFGNGHGDEDDELNMEDLMQFLRFMPIGVIPMMMINGMFGIANHFYEFVEDEEQNFLTAFGKNAITPVMPFASMTKSMWTAANHLVFSQITGEREDGDPSYFRVGDY